MKLSDWLSEQKKKPAWLAKKIGTTDVSARRYCNGERRPSDEVMLAIYQLTGGRVAPNDFYALPDLHAGERAMAHPGQLSLLDAVEQHAQACA